jgi:hypothetical protein
MRQCQLPSSPASRAHGGTGEGGTCPSTPRGRRATHAAKWSTSNECGCSAAGRTTPRRTGTTCGTPPTAPLGRNSGPTPYCGCPPLFRLSSWQRHRARLHQRQRVQPVVVVTALKRVSTAPEQVQARTAGDADFPPRAARVPHPFDPGLPVAILVQVVAIARRGPRNG